ncbi:MAG: MFS transporter [Betaproteobacteria bacterium]|nr:MFS transporter [Betaproteobacteria bacterium]
MYLIVFLNVIIHGCVIGSRVVMALFAIELGENPFSIGVMVALYSVSPLLLGVYSGRVSDRYGVRTPMMFGAILCGLGLLVPYLWRHVAALYISAAMIGTAFVFYNVSVQNLAGAWGPREERAKNFSTLSLGYSISSLVGPLVAGYAIEYLSHAAAYLIFSVSTLAAVAVLLFYRRIGQIELPKSSDEAPSAFALLRLPELRKVLITSALLVTGWDLYMFYLPLYAHGIGLSASTIGIVLGVFAVATLIVRFGLPYLVKRYTARRVLAVSMFCGAVTFVLFPFVEHAWLLGVLSFVIGLALGCGQPVILLMSYNRSPEGRAGVVTGIRFALNHLTHATVPVVAGALGSAFGMAPVFLMIAAVLAVSGYLAGTVRRSNEPPPPQT